MLLSNKTFFLEGILAEYKKKEKKYYLTWETLRTKLAKKGRDLFGITAKSTWMELKTAIEPFLGQEMMFSEHFGQWYFSTKMPFGELQAEITEKKTADLLSLLAIHKTKEKRSYLKFGLPLLKLFGFNNKTAPAAPVLEKIITPCLGSELRLLRKPPKTKTGKETLFLAYNVPLVQFLVESFQVQSLKKTFALKSIADDVPINQAKFVEVFNRMLDSGHFQIAKINDKFGITGVRLVESAAPSKSQESESSDYERFQEAFEKLDGGRRIYVRICNMRRELGWSEERFNTVLNKLCLVTHDY